VDPVLHAHTKSGEITPVEPRMMVAPPKV
jgi:hypothetical protein